MGPTGPTGPAGSANILGTINRIIKFTSATTGGNSLLFDNGTNVGLGTVAPAYPLHVISSAAITLRAENGNTENHALWGYNTAADGTGAGAGVIGITGQANSAGVRGENVHPSGTGIFGLGNDGGSAFFLVAGSGGAFTGTGTAIYGRATSAGVAQAIYTDNFGEIVRVNYWSGAVQYKIVGSGTVSTVVRDPTDPEGKRRVTLHAPEAPEIYFEDYGEGRLEQGFAHVELDPIFAANVLVDERHPLRVFIQIEEDDLIQGVVVTNKTAHGFDVVERNGGASSAPFQWHVVCNRADEVLAGGRVSRNADARFEVVPDDLPTGSVRAGAASAPPKR